MQGNLQVGSELGDEVDGDTGVYRPLLIIEGHLIADREKRLMPDIGIDVDTGAAVAIEGDEVSRGDVVTGASEQGHEWKARPREEDLPTVGMVVGLVGENVPWLRWRAALGRGCRIAVPTGDVAALYGMIGGVEQSTATHHMKIALYRSTTDPRAGYDRPPAGLRPGHEIDMRRSSLFKQTSVAT